MKGFSNKTAPKITLAQSRHRPSHPLHLSMTMLLPFLQHLHYSTLKTTQNHKECMPYYGAAPDIMLCLGIYTVQLRMGQYFMDSPKLGYWVSTGCIWATLPETIMEVEHRPNSKGVLASFGCWSEGGGTESSREATDLVAQIFSSCCPFVRSGGRAWD